MLDQLMDWVKGLVGGATEDLPQGMTDTLGGAAGEAAESAQTYGEDVAGEATAGAEEAIGGVTEPVQDVQEGADAVSGAVEDPGGAATDAATDIADDHLPGGGNG